jgi:threonine aldolase
MYGGGMRQVGILAAACLYALDHNLARLPEDHENALLLAKELADAPGVEVDPGSVDSNIVMIGVKGGDAPSCQERLAERGVLILAFGAAALRAVTHLDVSREDILEAAEVIREVVC